MQGSAVAPDWAQGLLEAAGPRGGLLGSDSEAEGGPAASRGRHRDKQRLASNGGRGAPPPGEHCAVPVGGGRSSGGGAGGGGGGGGGEHGWSGGAAFSATGVLLPSHPAYRRWWHITSLAAGVTVFLECAPLLPGRRALPALPAALPAPEVPPARRLALAPLFATE